MVTIGYQSIVPERLHSAVQQPYNLCNVVHVIPNPASDTQGNSTADNRHLTLAPDLKTGTQSIIESKTAAQHSYNNNSHS